MVVPWRLEVGEDSLKIDSFCYPGDVVSCGGGVESAIRDRISCVWSKWRESASLLVNHSIPLEERVKVYCACVRPALLYAVKTWALTERLGAMLGSCDHRMLRYMSRVRLQDMISNEEVKRRCGVENLEHRLRKMRLRWFGHVKCRDENSILRRAMELQVEGRRPVGRPKKMWNKIVEEDMRKLNITEDMAGIENSGGNSYHV